MDTKFLRNAHYIIKGFELEDPLVVERLKDLGLRVGLKFTLLNIVSFKSVYILQFSQTIIALNKDEMKCLIV